jgi:hypothetical protein
MISHGVAAGLTVLRIGSDNQASIEAMPVEKTMFRNAPVQEGTAHKSDPRH